MAPSLPHQEKDNLYELKREREADKAHANLWKIPDKIHNIFVGLVDKFIIANNRLLSDESK